MQANTYILMRKISECVRFSVLNTEIDPDFIGPHDFNESCYRIYNKLKSIIAESTDTEYIHRDDYKQIIDVTESFIKNHLLHFLIKYHKRLWKRFDVPRKLFFRVGKEWYADVDNIRCESKKYIRYFDERINVGDNFILKNNE